MPMIELEKSQMTNLLNQTLVWTFSMVLREMVRRWH